MNDKIKVNAIVQQIVTIDPQDALTALRKFLGLEMSDGFLKIEDENLILYTDVAYHGTPKYEGQEISNNPKWCALYNALNTIEDYLQNAEEQEWAKHIEQEEDESPVMGM